MKFSEWEYFKVYENYDCRKPEYSVSEGKLSIRLAGDNYTSAQFDSITTDIKPGCNYRINYELKTENPMARVIFGWYKGNEALVKGYLNYSGQEILCPDEAEYLKITLRFNGFDAYEGEISPVKGECMGEYKPKKVRLATVAIPHIFFPESQPPEYNLAETVKNIDRLCKREQPDLIVLTETFYTRKTLLPLPEVCCPIDCEAIRVIREKAKQYNTFIALSFSEVEDGNFYNSGILIDRKGEIAGKCHKCHLTMSEYENGLTPGREIKVFDTEIGKIGIAICWDIFFPEHVRTLQKQGVDIIVNPTAGYREGRIIERCKESGAYIVTSTAGAYEQSAIFNPKGEKLADASTHYGYACAEVDLNEPQYCYYLGYPSDGESKNIFLNETRCDLY